MSFSMGNAAQCEVARLPSSNPAAARMIEPEHTDVVQVAVLMRLTHPVQQRLVAGVFDGGHPARHQNHVRRGVSANE